MRVSGDTSSRSWRPARRAAAVLGLAALVVAAGLISPVHAAIPEADTDPATASTESTEPAPVTDTSQPGRLSTGKRINPAADDPASPAEGVEPSATDPSKTPADAPTGTDPEKQDPATDAVTPGDEGTERLKGDPGVCDDEGCGRLQPIVECSFKDPGTGLYNTVWSYRGGRIPVKIPPGWFNFYFPGAVNRGQPGVFTPGYHRSVVITTHKGPLTWVLGLRKATAPGRACGHNPVPITGAGLSSIVTLFAVGGLLGVVLWVRGRRRRSIRA